MATIDGTANLCLTEGGFALQHAIDEGALDVSKLKVDKLKGALCAETGPEKVCAASGPSRTRMHRMAARTVPVPGQPCGPEGGRGGLVCTVNRPHCHGVRRPQ